MSIPLSVARPDPCDEMIPFLYKVDQAALYILHVSGGYFASQVIAVIVVGTQFLDLLLLDVRVHAVIRLELTEYAVFLRFYLVVGLVDREIARGGEQSVPPRLAFIELITEFSLRGRSRR